VASLGNSAEITRLLKAWGRGDSAALDSLTPLVYEQLHRMARRYMRNERPGHTLQATALVNEAFLRLVDIRDLDWTDRTHFFAVCARVMRRILVDHARAQLYAKRGGGAQQVSLTEADGLAAGAEDLITLNDALAELAELDPRQGQIVELKFFSGMTIDEISEVTLLSTATVEREWRSARAWLSDALGK